MLPSLAITFSLSIVSLLPTTSDKIRGRNFSTHGSSPSVDGVGGEEEEEAVMGLGGLAGDGARFLGVLDVGCCSSSITSSSSSWTSWMSSSDMVS